MARVYTRIGDIFSVQVSEHAKKYFQLIAFDLLQLNSDVIRAFKHEYLLDEKPSVVAIVTGEVSFYAHCVTKFGVKMGLWNKVGSSKDVGNLDGVIFKGTNDYGSKPGEQVLVSHKWYIWRLGDAKFTRVGELVGDNRRAEIGVIVNPYDIINRIKTGEYHFLFPSYE